MKFSEFCNKYRRQAGILSLMRDMGEAFAASGDDCIMMGGGNPGFVPEFQMLTQTRLQQKAADPELSRRLLGVYCSPQGELEFLAKLVSLLHNEHGWKIGPENICLTNGSQSGFFYFAYRSQSLACQMCAPG